MQKYGVETPNQATMCPLCGQPAQRHGAVLLCPTHGSKPFETLTPAHGVESAGTGEDQRKYP